MNTWLKERYFLPDATQRSGLRACLKVSCSSPPPRSSFILQALSCLVDLVLTSGMSAAFFRRVDDIVHSLIQKTQAKLEVTIFYRPVPLAVYIALLRYHLTIIQSYQKALKTLADTVDEVVISFIERECLHLKVGFDAFASVRVDGGKNSPLWSMLKAAPLECDEGAAMRRL
jgi:hypothetical protein